MLYKINKKLITQKLDNKIIIFDSNKSVLYTLNETGSYIFLKLKRGWNNEQIIKSLAQKYEVEANKLEADFTELVKSLVSRKIVTISK
jgi:hypothetical protein